MDIAAEIPNPSFAGHETFTLRCGWLKKAVDAVARDPGLFGRQDALVFLGVGKNMVRAIRYWALSTGVIEEDPERSKNRGRWLRVSRIGRLLFADDGLDPYLERPGTLWLVHYLLVAESKCPTTWYWFFNHFVDTQFSSDQLVAALANLAKKAGWKRVAENTLRRDVSCLIRTYGPSRTSRTVVLEDTLDCPLTELSLISELENGQAYALSRTDRPSLPANIFAFALLRYWKTEAPDRNTLQFDEVVYRPRSPGRVFRLSEDATSRYLASIDELTGGRIGYNVTAGLMQLYKRNEINPFKLLNHRFSF